MDGTEDFFSDKKLFLEAITRAEKGKFKDISQSFFQQKNRAKFHFHFTAKAPLIERREWPENRLTPLFYVRGQFFKTHGQVTKFVLKAKKQVEVYYP